MTTPSIDAQEVTFFGAKDLPGVQLRTQHKPSSVTPSYVEVVPGWTLYVEESGNPNGTPAVFVHGGPGIKFYETDKQWFDPEKYRIICFQQRGTHNCTPTAEDLETDASVFKDVTIDTLAQDMEALRKHLHIDKWLVFGGSWGSTMSIYYAQQFSECCLGVVLRGIFLATDEENSVFYDQGKGTAAFDHLIAYAKEKGHTITNSDEFYAAYNDLIVKENDIPACRLWKCYEDFIDNPWDKRTLARILRDDKETTGEERSIAVWETQMFRYLPKQVNLLDPQRLQKMQCPIKMVQGKKDRLCHWKVAESLAEGIKAAGGNVNFSLIPQGFHSPYSPEMTDALVRATDTFASEGHF